MDSVNRTGVDGILTGSTEDGIYNQRLQNEGEYTDDYCQLQSQSF